MSFHSTAVRKLFPSLNRPALVGVVPIWRKYAGRVMRLAHLCLAIIISFTKAQGGAHKAMLHTCAKMRAMTHRAVYNTLLLILASMGDVTAMATKVSTGANTGGDPLTEAHVRNWMECVRSRKQPNAPIEAGYNHATAVIMTNAAYRTGEKVTFDDKTQEVMAGGKVFKY